MKYAPWMPEVLAEIAALARGDDPPDPRAIAAARLTANHPAPGAGRPSVGTYLDGADGRVGVVVWFPDGPLIRCAPDGRRARLVNPEVVSVRLAGTTDDDAPFLDPT